MTLRRSLSLFALLAPVACAAAPVRVGSTRPATPSFRRAPPVVAATPDGPAHLRGTVTVAPGFAPSHAPIGRLVVGYFTRDELAQFRSGAVSMRTFIDASTRFRVAAPRVDLSAPGARATFELEVPPGEWGVVAVLDTHEAFLETLFGAGDGNFLGYSADAARAAPGATVALDVPLATERHVPPRPERCRGDRTELVVLDAPDTAGRVGNDPHRRLCVYLPASYATARRRRYPVIYLLPGLAGTDTSRFRRDAQDRPADDHVGRIADELANAGSGREVIFVGIDTSTRTGSTYLVDSPTTGAFETFVTRQVVPAIDARYRTIAAARARALYGYSTGGFNAVSLAMRHPELFTVVAAGSPDALDLRAWLLTPDGTRARPLWLGLMRLEDAVGGPGQMTSYAADWSPDPAAPRGFRWPADLATGAPVPEVWSRWLAQSPSELLRTPAGLAAARDVLAGRIFITVGRDDEAELFAPAEAFSRQLTAAGVAHQFVPTEGGHILGAPLRLRAMLEFALRTLPPPATP